MGAPGQTKLSLLLAIPSGGLAIALTTQITALSWLLQTKYGLAIDDIALVWAAGPLAGILGQLAVGHFSDKTWCFGGRRRPYLLLSGALTAAALIALLNLSSIAELSGGVALVALAGGIALTLDLAINFGLNPARALIADVLPAGQARSVAFGYMQAVSGFVGVAITIVGAMLGNVAMIFAAAILVFPLTSLAALLIKEPKELAGVETSGRLTMGASISMLSPIAPAALFSVLAAADRAFGFGVALGPAAVATAIATLVIGVGVFGSARRDETALSRRIFLAQGLSWVGIFSMFVFLAPVVTERLGLADDEQVGRAIAIALGLFNLVAAAVPIVLLMPLTKRFRRSHVHAAAMSVMALSFTLIGSWISDSAELWLCIALAGVGWGSLVSLPYVIFCDRVGSGRLGLMLGLFNVSVVVPQLVVSLGLGALAPSMTSKDDLFLIAAGALIASAIAWACIPPIQERAPA